MTDCNNSNQQDKFFLYAHRKFGVVKYCHLCDNLIILRKHELYDIQNSGDWLLGKRVLIKTTWEAFEADDHARKHICKQRHQKSLEQWLEV